MVKALTIFCIVIALTSAYRWPERDRPVEGVNPPPTYQIDLDLPPSQRWTQMITENKDNILAAANYAKQQLPNLLLDITSEKLIEDYDPIMAQEIISIAEAMGAPVNETFWVNMMYELQTYCTSIVIQDENNNIFHGRNLDWDMQSYIEPLIFPVEFYRNGSLLFRASVIAGMVGFLTGEKHGVFSVSADQRESRIINEDASEHPDIDDMELAENIYQITVNHRFGMLWSIRRALENATTYEEAANMLATTPIAAPVYYIISGTQPGQGAVLTMDRDGLFQNASLDAENGVWYLVQTNYDRDLPDPPSDDRRTVAQDRLDALGRENVNFTTLFDDVLSLYPNNNNGTVQTVLFAAATDTFNMTIWWSHASDDELSQVHI